MIEFECKKCGWIRREPYDVSDCRAQHDGICQTCKATDELTQLVETVNRGRGITLAEVIRQEKAKRLTLQAKLLDLEAANRNRSNRLNEAQAIIDELRARIAKFEEFAQWVSTAPVSTGVCCCGDSMENHDDAMNAGHAALDEWDYALRGWLEQLGIKP